MIRLKQIEELVKEYGDKLSAGELEVNTSELYGKLLSLQYNVKDVEWEYQDVIRILIYMVESRSYDPHSFYDTDIIKKAKWLSEYE